MKAAEEKRYPMKNARVKFTELIAEVQGGARVVITKSGRPVVDVVPHDPFGATIPPRTKPVRVSLKPGPKSLADELTATRGDR